MSIDVNWAELLFPPGYQFSDRRDLSRRLSPNEWRTGLQGKIQSNRWIDNDFCVLGVPFDTGAGYTRGAAFGPAVLRPVLEGANYWELGDARIIPLLIHDDLLSEAAISDIREFSGSVSLPVSPLSVVESIVRGFFDLTLGQLPLFTIGGDHSVSLPILRGLIDSSVTSRTDLGVIHFDAHADAFETHLGLRHGFATWAYHAAQLLSGPNSLIQFGVHTYKGDSEALRARTGIKQFRLPEIRAKSIPVIAAEAIDLLKRQGKRTLYLTFDVDCLDRDCFSSCGTPEEGGFALDEVLRLIDCLRWSASKAQMKWIGGDFVEFSPFGTIAYPSDRKRDYKIAAQVMSMMLHILSG